MTCPICKKDKIVMVAKDRPLLMGSRRMTDPIKGEVIEYKCVFCEECKVAFVEIAKSTISGKPIDNLPEEPGKELRKPPKKSRKTSKELIE